MDTKSRSSGQTPAEQQQQKKPTTEQPSFDVVKPIAEPLERPQTPVPGVQLSPTDFGPFSPDFEQQPSATSAASISFSISTAPTSLSGPAAPAAPGVPAGRKVLKATGARQGPSGPRSEAAWMEERRQLLDRNKRLEGFYDQLRVDYAKSEAKVAEMNELQQRLDNVEIECFDHRNQKEELANKNTELESLQKETTARAEKAVTEFQAEREVANSFRFNLLASTSHAKQVEAALKAERETAESMRNVHQRQMQQAEDSISGIIKQRDTLQRELMGAGLAAKNAQETAKTAEGRAAQCEHELGLAMGRLEELTAANTTVQTERNGLQNSVKDIEQKLAMSVNEVESLKSIGQEQSQRYEAAQRRIETLEAADGQRAAMVAENESQSAELLRLKEDLQDLKQATAQMQDQLDAAVEKRVIERISNQQAQTSNNQQDFKARLATSERTKAELEQKLQTLHQGATQQAAEREKEHASLEQSHVAKVKELEQHIDSIGEKHASEKAAWQREVQSLEENIARDKSPAQSATVSRLSQLQQDFKALQQTFATKEKEHEDRLHARDKEHKKQLTAGIQQRERQLSAQEAEYNERLQAQNEEHKKYVDAQKDKHQQQLSAKNDEVKRILSGKEESIRQQLIDNNKEHETRLSAKDQAHADQLKIQREVLERQLADQRKESKSQLKAQATDRERAEADWLAQLNMVRSRLNHEVEKHNVENRTLKTRCSELETDLGSKQTMLEIKQHEASELQRALTAKADSATIRSELIPQLENSSKAADLEQPHEGILQEPSNQVHTSEPTLHESSSFAGQRTVLRRSRRQPRNHTAMFITWLLSMSAILTASIMSFAAWSERQRWLEANDATAHMYTAMRLASPEAGLWRWSLGLLASWNDESDLMIGRWG